MNGILDILVALLSAIGLFSLGWFCFGKGLLWTPSGQNACVCTVLLISGGAEGLPETLKHLRWISGTTGVCPCFLLVDMGLSPEGRKVAERLMQKTPNLIFSTRAEVPAHLDCAWSKLHKGEVSII